MFSTLAWAARALALQTVTERFPVNGLLPQFEGVCSERGGRIAADAHWIVCVARADRANCEHLRHFLRL
jgi:hypothetical protein